MDLSLKQIKKEWHGTLKSYLIGFTVSLILTIISFSLRDKVMIAGFALTQAVCQLFLFLHLGSEAKPRWETIVFYFIFLILLIIVLGSLWIMFDLNRRMMMQGM